MAAITQKIFLTVCISVKEQQKGSEAALISTWFREASGTSGAVVPGTLHVLRGTAHRAPAQIDIEGAGIQLPIFLFSPLKPLNSSQPSTNMLREVTG